jgi:hypothetical protein
MLAGILLVAAGWTVASNALGVALTPYAWQAREFWLVWAPRRR